MREVEVRFRGKSDEDVLSKFTAWRGGEGSGKRIIHRGEIEHLPATMRPSGYAQAIDHHPDTHSMTVVYEEDD